MVVRILPSLFDAELINRIPLSCHFKTGQGCGTNSEAWVWIFLKAMLTTLGDEDDTTFRWICPNCRAKLIPLVQQLHDLLKEHPKT